MSSTSHAIDSIRRLDEHAGELLDVAQGFQAAAGKPHSSATAPAALRRLEEALQALSASWYEIAADAAPAIIERRERRVAEAPYSPHRGLSREQEVHLMSTLHDVAAALARCARSCREGRSTVAPLLAARVPDQLPAPHARSLLRHQGPAAVA